MRLYLSPSVQADGRVLPEVARDLVLEHCLREAGVARAPSPAKRALRLEIPFWKQICRACSFVTDMKLGSNSLWNRRWLARAPAPRVRWPLKPRRVANRDV